VIPMSWELFGFLGMGLSGVSEVGTDCELVEGRIVSDGVGVWFSCLQCWQGVVGMLEILV